MKSIRSSLSAIAMLTAASMSFAQVAGVVNIIKPMPASSNTSSRAVDILVRPVVPSNAQIAQISYDTLMANRAALIPPGQSGSICGSTTTAPGIINAAGGLVLNGNAAAFGGGPGFPFVGQLVNVNGTITVSQPILRYGTGFFGSGTFYGTSFFNLTSDVPCLGSDVISIAGLYSRKADNCPGGYKLAVFSKVPVNIGVYTVPCPDSVCIPPDEVYEDRTTYTCVMN